MKKLLTILILVFAAAITQAQTFDPEVVVNGLKNRNLSSPDSRFGAMRDVKLPLLVRTPAVQFTFTQIENMGGEWRLTQPFTIGYSYIYTFATGVLHPDSSMTIENRFFFGAGLNYGLKTDFEGSAISSLPVGAIVGYSRFGVFGGYDVINEKPIIGISANLLNFPLLQKTTRFTVR